jgi:hypothetical protein
VSNQPSPKPSDTIQDQVERLTSVAKKLSSTGKEAQALETYRQAAELMPGAPWLQFRTAELARKLKQPEVAAEHYRRTSTAFIRAGFPKRALGPLRSACALRGAALPKDPSGFSALSLELAELQRALGLPADAVLSLASANDALKAAGCTERVPSLTEIAHGAGESSAIRDPSLPPESGVKPSQGSIELGVLARVREALKP